jgi:hypothetical protein
MIVDDDAWVRGFDRKSKRLRRDCARFSTRLRDAPVHRPGEDARARTGGRAQTRDGSDRGRIAVARRRRASYVKIGLDFDFDFGLIFLARAV